MATLSSELTLVMRFHQISQNYSARPAVARRNTLPTLLRFLQSKDRQIRKYALEAVEMLAQHPDNVEYLGEYPKLVDSVFSIYKEAQYDDPELCERASSVLDALEPTFVGEDPRKAEVVRRATQEGRLSHPSRSRDPSVASLPRSDGNSVPTSKPDTEEHVSYDSVCQREQQRPTSILNSSADTERQTNTTQYSIDHSVLMDRSASAVSAVQSPLSAVLEVPALQDSANRKDIEALLLSVQGIVSYTVSPSLRQIRLFLSNVNALSKVQHALASAGYINLLLRSEKMTAAEVPGRQPSTTQQGRGKKSFYDDEVQPPSYLQTAKSFASSLYSAVIVYTKPDSNTLAARVQRQRELDADTSHNPIAERVARTFANWW